MIDKLKLFWLLSCFASLSLADAYDRNDFNYRSYKSDTDVGFYTNKTCDFINIDHVVSLKDAYESGASSWSDLKKESFANDTFNHVPSCGRVNSSKGSAGPSDFLRRSNDGRGLEYKIVRFCEYVEKYYAVKLKYVLSFGANSKATFQSCDVAIYATGGVCCVLVILLFLRRYFRRVLQNSS